MSRAFNINKYLIITILILLGLFGLSYLDILSTSNKNTSSTKKFQATEFLNLLAKNGSFNDSIYIEKLISVEGIVEKVNDLNNRRTLFLQGDVEHKKSIICDMHKSQYSLIEGINIGDTICVKGIYKGYLKDIILLNCIISTE